MRKIREVLRLRHAMGLSRRKIGPMVGVGQTTVREYLGRAAQAGLSWPLPAGLEDDEALERLLFPPPPALPAAERGTPDWAVIHRELRRKGVTPQLLWQEYRACHPDGFGYSWFCESYRVFAGKLSPTLRRTHPAGERMFVDYAGQTAEVIDPLTGEVRTAQVFIAVLGASSYTFAMVTWTQDLQDWVMAHVEAFAFFGGVPVQVVCDNLKSGITKPSRYEPTLTATYREMAAHYEVAVLPARVRKPRDKAKVEVAAQVVERWILARLRNRRFFSLPELRAAVADLLTDLNGRVTRHLGTSRRAMFEDLDRPALRPLPERPYEYAEWQSRRVGIDYHVEVERHFYSVPYRLLKETVDVRLTAGAVEFFHKGRRVAVHVRSGLAHRHTTVADHMPSNHRAFLGWTHERVLRDAAAIGPNAAAMAEVIMRERKHHEQGFRSCVGILRLAKPYGNDRLEAACERALEIGARSYTSLQSILKNGLDHQPVAAATDHAGPDHANVRGPGYYH